MATITLFRLEHPVSNAGPWQTCNYARSDFPTGKQYKAALMFRNYINEKLCLDTFPGAVTDFGYSFRPGIHHCACPSKTALHKWFGTDQAYVRKMLLDAGFVIKRISIDSSRALRGRSGLQVAFDPDEAQNIDVISVKDLTAKKKKVIITQSTN